MNTKEKLVLIRAEIDRRAVLPLASPQVVITANPIAGFTAAWMLPGYKAAQRYLRACTAEQIERILSVASPYLIAQILSMVGDIQIERIMAWADENLLAKIFGMVGPAQIERIMSVINPCLIGRIMAFI